MSTAFRGNRHRQTQLQSKAGHGKKKKKLLTSCAIRLWRTDALRARNGTLQCSAGPDRHGCHSINDAMECLGTSGWTHCRIPLGASQQQINLIHWSLSSASASLRRVRWTPFSHSPFASASAPQRLAWCDEFLQQLHGIFIDKVRHVKYLASLLAHKDGEKDTTAIL